MATELLRLGRDGIIPVTWELSKTDGAGSLTGWASVYNVIDQQDDVVMRGAFTKTIQKWRATKGVIPLTLDHENGVRGTIGSLTDVRDSAYGLKTTFGFASTKDAQDARTLAKEGHVNGLSIFGSIVSKSEEMIEGRPIRVLREVDLMFVGLTPAPANTSARLLKVAASDTPWSNFSASDYSIEQWRRACLIDTGEGDPTSKSRYKLPVREPSGAVNRNGVHAAAAALAGARGGIQASSEQKAKAARALMRMYSSMDEDPPDSLRRMAGNASSTLDVEILPDVWVADMRSALAITDEVTRTLAVKNLISNMAPTADSEDGTEEDETDSSTEKSASELRDEAAEFALSVIGETKAAAGSGLDSIDDIIASVEASSTADDLDRLAAELQERI